MTQEQIGSGMPRPPLAGAMKRFVDAADQAGANRQRLRDALNR
jgi:hypothetical protein